ncbi:MAG: photosystem II stability/assembly factor-like uncharacterized protein [Granulosicoccus sp.]|jgi:photosystem II stability/assembly factor-like uncharacterized protein
MKPIIYTFLTTLLFLSFSNHSFSQDDALKVSFGGMNARSIGPAVMSGRITTLDAVESDPQILYLGAANGGVWKSNSAGTTFRPVFDEHTQSIGAIAIDQNFPDTVWVGTGEPWTRNSISYGDGIYKSTNGGNTWNNMGLKNTERISKIQIHPKNSNIIYVAAQGHLWNAHADRGVYKTTDSGKTWEKVLFVDENTGCADLSLDKNNPEIIYAAMWDHRRTPDFFTSGGKGSGLFKSIDGGKNWNKIHNGLPTGILGRMAIEVAPSNSNILYATVECEKKEEKGLYKSEDAGATWKHVSKDFNVTVRPFYFSRLVIDPTDENIIYKGGLNLTVSKTGGDSWRTADPQNIHSDIHAVWINPNNNKHVVIGTDGGGYRSLDGAYSFEMFMDLPLSQFYHISVDNEKPYNIYGGLQDNGSWVGPSESGGGIENKDWSFTNGGDGFYSFRHPTDKNIIYSESQGGNIVRYDMSDGQRKDIKPLPNDGDPDYRFNWNAPMHISPNNPERLYFGAQFLFKTETRGDDWTKISPDLTTNDLQRQRQKKSGGLSIDNSTAENNTTIYAIGESPLDEKIIWVGTDDGLVQVTSNGGTSWENVSKNIPNLPKGLWVTSIEPSHFNKNMAYVTIDGHKSGDLGKYIFKTTDLGRTWKSLATETLEGYAHVLREDLKSENLLFLGMERGFYISVDGGVSWKRFDNNMPHNGVRAIVVHPREDAVIVGTHGRGIFIIDDITPLRQISKEVVNSKLHFFETKPTLLKLSKGGSPFGGAGNFVGANPRNVAYITYYMKKRHTFGKMTLEIFDQNGKLIKDLPAGKSGGINLVEVPVRLKSPKAAPTNNRMALFGSIFPPALPAGDYTVKIKKGKDVFETKIKLAYDPDANYSVAERAEQHEAAMKLYNMTNELGYMYFAMEAMHTQANDLITEKGKKKLKKRIKQMAEDVEKYKASLVALEGDFYVDEGEALREEISTLFLGVSQYPGKPSSSQMNKLKTLEGKMEKVHQKFAAFKSEMETVNRLLQAEEKEPIKIKTFEEYMKD